MSRVSVEIKDHIAHVTLTRGDKMNALDTQMIEAIIAAGDEVAASKARVAVLTGEGDSFCAGLDKSSFMEFAGKSPQEILGPRDWGDSNRFQQVSMAWRKVPMPVIAAVQGAVFGGGLQLALGADIRIAAPDAKLSLMEMKWGLVPDMGGMAVLPALVRSDVLRLMTYTARPFPAQQALEWGLVTSIADDPKAAALELAEEIAGKSPKAIRAAKRLIDVAEAEGRAAVLQTETDEQAGLIGQAEQIEVVMATMQGRKPNFD